MLVALPTELLIKVLALLPWQTLLLVKRVARMLNVLITETVLLTYIVELGSSSMVDGPSGRFTTADRLVKLRRLREGWKAPEEASRTAITFTQVITAYDLQKGVLTIGHGNDETWTTLSLRYYRLDSRVNEVVSENWCFIGLGEGARDYTTDPAQDLVVLLEEFDARDPSLCRFHLRTMSTGTPHPLAKAPVLRGRTKYLTRDVEGRFDYFLVLRGKLLACGCTLTSEDQGEISTNLWIWDWPSGALVFTLDSKLHASFTFLDDQSFALAINDSAYHQTNDWWIDVYFIRQGSATPARFMLPRFRPGEIITVTGMMLRSDPNDSSIQVQEYAHTGKQEGSHRRAFHASPDERILLLSCDVSHQGRLNSQAPGIISRLFSIAIRGSALRSIAEDQLKSGNLESDSSCKGLSWEHWGPSSTRWVRRWTRNGFVNDVHSQRCIVDAEGPGNERALSVMDFNPYILRQDTSGPSASPMDTWEFGDRVQTRLVNQSTCIALPYIFKEPIVSSLPYEETFYPIEGELGFGECAFCLDEERILLFKTQVLLSVPY
ncbi:hypothetical protein FRB93_006500 [Tulasnella sp. JGI-2019a]|nr:hypothetical protein FRB93_006500 [Tulasnella sp. JGI-2019a]